VLPVLLPGLAAFLGDGGNGGNWLLSAVSGCVSFFGEDPLPAPCLLPRPGEDILVFRAECCLPLSGLGELLSVPVFLDFVGVVVVDFFLAGIFALGFLFLPMAVA
jgi:hypothetical protein